MPGADLHAPGGASRLLDYTGINIAALSQILFTLLSFQEPFYKDVLDWIQFAYMGDWTGSYMEPASMVLFRSMVLEGYPLLSLTLVHLRQH